MLEVTGYAVGTLSNMGKAHLLNAQISTLGLYALMLMNYQKLDIINEILFSGTKSPLA